MAALRLEGAERHLPFEGLYGSPSRQSMALRSVCEAVLCLLCTAHSAIYTQYALVLTSCDCCGAGIAVSCGPRPATEQPLTAPAAFWFHFLLQVPYCLPMSRCICMHTLCSHCTRNQHMGATFLHSEGAHRFIPSRALQAVTTSAPASVPTCGDFQHA